MNKTLIATILASIIPLAASAQMEQYCNASLRVAQKEGTDSVVRNYFSALETDADTVYALLYVPGFSPRLENPLPKVNGLLKRADPDAEFVLVSANCPAGMARKYNRKLGIGADHYIYDNDLGYAEFLSFNSAYPVGSNILKVVRSTGRVLWSGCVVDFRDNFWDDLVRIDAPQPYGTYGNDVEMMSFPLPDDLVSAELGYRTMPLVGDDPLFALGRLHWIPALKGGVLALRDDYNGRPSCFWQAGDTMLFAGHVTPTDEEKRRYMHISKEQQDLVIGNGSAYFMPIGIEFLPDGNLGFAYSMPEVYLEDEGYFSFYNHPLLLVRDAATLEPRPAIALADGFFNNMDSVSYEYLNFNVIDSCHLVLKQYKTGWPIEGFEEFTGDAWFDSFMDEFYDGDNCYAMLVDARTGEKIRQFGPLPDVARETKTGYCYASLCVGSDGKEMVYTDVSSGEIHLADNATPWDVKRTYRAFALDPARLPAIDESLFYTPEYANEFTRYFCRFVRNLRLTEDKIHVLCSVSHSKMQFMLEPVYEYRVIDRRSGEVETSFRVDKQFDDETMLAAGLSEDDEPVLFYLSERGGRYYMTEVREK